MGIEVWGLRSGNEVRAWYLERDVLIMGLARGWPACWGANYRVDDGLYVSGSDFEAVLPTSEEQDLWLTLANEGPDGAHPALTYEEAHHLLDHPDLLRHEAERATSDDAACCFFTEEQPDWMERDELDYLADERPDLFATDELRAHPCLVGPAMAAGLDVSVGGERTWASMEGNDLDGLWAESELRAYFASCPDLEGQRAAGTTFEDWVAENERFGMFTRVSEGGRGNAPLSEAAARSRKGTAANRDLLPDRVLVHQEQGER